MSREEKHRKYLNEHERLANLFATDRFAFEMERKRLIDQTIANMSCSQEFKEKLRTQQKEYDRVLKGIGSTKNRLAMIQALLWHHVVNNWQPALQKYLPTVSSLMKTKKDRSALSLVKK